MAFKKIKKAIKSYAKNVAGGAKIVAGAVKGAAKSAGKSLGANPLTALRAQTGRNTLAPGTAIKPPAKDAPLRDLKGNIINSNQIIASAVKSKDPKALSIALARYGSGFTTPNAPTALSPGQFGGTTAPPQRINLKSGTSTRSSNIPQPIISPPGKIGLTSFSSSGFSQSQGSSLSSNTPNTPSTNVINAPNVLNTANTKLTFPEATIPDYSQYIPTPIEQQATDAGEEKDTALKDLLKSMAEPPDDAKAYKKAQKETQILQKQQLVNDLTGQLNGIVAKGQAQQLAQVGQGRGIPSEIIGGIQAQIGRETAIAALPIQAQLSAAQGNLEMAENNLNTLFKIYQEDATREFEYKKEVKKMVYEYASEKEKRALEKLDEEDDRAYDSKKTNISAINQIAIEVAKNGGGNVLAKFTDIDMSSPNAVNQALGLSKGFLSDPIEKAYKQAQISKIYADIEESKRLADEAGTLNGKPQTAAQSSANGYADRLVEASTLITELGNQFTGKFSQLPLFNFMKSDDRQVFEQAKRNFVTAILRRESGAAISDSEFNTAEQQYFPQPGDGSDVLAQKEVSRNTAINNFYREANKVRPIGIGEVFESNGMVFIKNEDGSATRIR